MHSILNFAIKNVTKKILLTKSNFHEKIPCHYGDIPCHYGDIKNFSEEKGIKKLGYLKLGENLETKILTLPKVQFLNEMFFHQSTQKGFQGGDSSLFHECGLILLLPMPLI